MARGAKIQKLQSPPFPFRLFSFTLCFCGPNTISIYPEKTGIYTKRLPAGLVAGL
jgi:hypothetical protein